MFSPVACFRNAYVCDAVGVDDRGVPGAGGGFGARFGWKLQRLRAMSAPEVLWRVSQAAIVALPGGGRFPGGALAAGEEWNEVFERFRLGAGRPVFLDRARATEIARGHRPDVAELLVAADRAAAGRFAFFGYPEVELSDPIDWHVDPLSDHRWPAIRSDAIDPRRAAGDVKWIWELNRLQHLPVLAEAWLFTGERHYADVALRHMESWMVQNPPGIGIAWRGGFEAGVRAVSVAIALQGLRDAPGLTADLFERIARMLDESARRCWVHRSRYSSANNHVVGELAGAAVVSMLLPELRGAKQRERRVLDTLARESDRQILSDGAGAEQSAAYQMFTVELLMVVAALLRLRGEEPPPRMTAAIVRSARYLSTVVGDHGADPRNGDDDEGRALRLGAEPLCTVRDHLAAVEALTGVRFRPPRGAGAAPADATIAASWLAAARRAGPERPAFQSLGPARADCAGDAAPAAEPPGGGAAYFPYGGTVVLRTAQRRLIVDVGPLGFLSLAAHGHADALSITLSLDHRPIVVDPGAGSYYGHPQWRAVHRGTRVHATACVDDLDQSVSGGPFLWSRHARVRVRGVDPERGIVDAEHDGYRRLSDPVTHRRWVIAPSGRSRILVVDLIRGAGRHRLQVGWPLHPDLSVQVDGSACRVFRPDPGGGSGAESPVSRVDPVLRMNTASTARLDYRLYRGDRSENLGWYSRRLESRVPAPLVTTMCSATVPIVVATLLEPWGHGHVDSAGFRAELDTAAIRLRWECGERVSRVLIDRRHGACVEWHDGGGDAAAADTPMHGG